MKIKLWLTGLAVAVSLVGAGRALAQDKNGGFGALEALPPETVKAKAMAWLKTATNNNAGKIQSAEALWNREDRSVLDNLADTFALGDAKAEQLIKQVRDAGSPPPLGVPDVLKNEKADAFMRANLGLAVARILSNRRVHEEALAILNNVNPEQTVDPAAYLFYRAVCEHALLKRDDASRTIVRLIQDAADSPERYKTVAALMLLDMQTWKKDLGNVSRLMNNSERRLDIGRGGPETQKLQKEIINRLDELIKELEQKAKKGGGGGGGGGGGDPNGGSCPDGGSSGGQAGGANPKSPMPDSQIATNGGSGRVDVARLQKITDQWGKMLPGERAKAMQEIQDMMQHMSPIHREAFERYFDEINNQTIPSKNK
jgi:hypothetical protein